MKKLLSIALIAALIVSVTPLMGINGVNDSTGFVYATEEIPIDEDHFPDANFRAFLTKEYGSSFDPTSVCKLDVQCNHIASLEGIQYFTSLEILYCSTNYIDSLDLSYNTALVELWCDQNNLSSLDLSHNTALKYLKCCINMLSSLDVSHNTALEYLDCQGNLLNNLDLSHNTALKYLYCNGNKLRSLNLGNNDSLYEVNASDNNLRSLDVSHNPGLSFLYCTNNNLGKLYVGNGLPDHCYHDEGVEIIYGEGPGSEPIEIQPETGDDISDMAYLAMSDMAYLNVDNLVNAGALSAEKLDDLGRNKSDSDITMWGDNVVNDIDPSYELNWGHLYKQCLQGWEIIDSDRDDSSGFFVVTFKKDNHVVVSYRGSDSFDTALFTDWLKDDNYAAFVKQASPQMLEAIAYARKIRKEYNRNIGYDLSFTGHSLGGGLALLASMATGEKAVPFDSAPTVEVGYYVLSEIMAQNFHGIDKWNFSDIVNEACPCGNYETGILYGKKLWDPKKNYVALQNMYTGNNGPVTDIVAPHSRESILTFDEEKMQFALSPVTDSKIFGTNDSYSVNVRQVDLWIRGTGPIGQMKYLSTPKGILRLGTSLSDNKVTTTRGFVSEADVIYGGDESDNIAAYEGPDTLIGGSGDDILDGGIGSDTYVYYYGDGSDLISDFSGNDTLELVGFPSDSTITVYDDDENYIEVAEDGDTIVNISRNRSGNLINSFVIKFLDENGNTMREPVKLQNFNNWTNYKSFKIACPVSVEILDPNGQVVNTISDGAESMLHTEYANMYCALNEETGEYEKYIILKDGYTIHIIGADDGEMDISVRECEEGKEDKLYSASDLPVSTGEVYTVDTELQSVSSEAGDVYSLHEEEDEHTFSYYISNGDATCVKDGTKTAICDSCDATDTIPDEGSATGHKFSAWKITKKATELAAGKKSRTCSACGKTDTKTIAKLKPTLPAVTIVTPVAAKKAATIKWKKVSTKNKKKIAKIQIQYSTDKNFKKNVKTVYARKSATSKKITKLKSKKTYYVRIRAYKSSRGVVHVSKWSSTKYAKVK